MANITDGILVFVLGCGALLVVLFFLYKLKNKYDKREKNKKESKLVSQNTISIIHNNNTSILKALNAERSYINMTTFSKFIKAYEKLDKDKDIHIVIHTPGGMLASVEAIVNCMINHKGKGRIIGYIPYYAYSGGCAIAIACHEIRMLPTSVVGPCDAQLASKMQAYSVKSIVDSVNKKLDRGEPVKEKWLATAHTAEICQKRQKKFIDKLIKHGIFNEEVGNTVYSEFFTGKYNHDTSFSAYDMQSMGLNVSIVDKMPQQIKDLFEDID